LPDDSPEDERRGEDVKKWVVMLMAVALVALMVFSTGASAGIRNIGKGSACSPFAGGSCQGSESNVTAVGSAENGNNNTNVQFSGGNSLNELLQEWYG
jgi:hypothetical protein